MCLTSVLAAKRGIMHAGGNAQLPASVVSLALAVVILAVSGHNALADVRGEWVKDRYPIERGGRWGYINPAGAIAIKPRFDEASYFSEGLAAVRIGHRFGYIDKAGKIAIAPRFTKALGFREGLAWVEGDRNGFIDRTGAIVVTPPPGTYCREFRDGLALAVPLPAAPDPPDAARPSTPKVDGADSGAQHPSAGQPAGGSGSPAQSTQSAEPQKLRCGYIDRSGGYAINPQFDAATDFEFGVAAAAVDGKWGLIDRDGDFVVPPQYDGATYVSEGVAVVRIGHHAAFITKLGRRLNDVDYDDAQPFIEGLAPVEIDGKWGFIDKAGKLAIPAKFDLASEFFNGRAVVLVAGRYGYIDRSGKLVIPATYGYAYLFLGDLAAVSDDPGVPDGPDTGYINRSGRLVWNPREPPARSGGRRANTEKRQARNARR